MIFGEKNGKMVFCGIDLETWAQIFLKILLVLFALDSQPKWDLSIERYVESLIVNITIDDRECIRVKVAVDFSGCSW